MKSFINKIPMAILLAALTVSAIVGAFASSGIISPALNIISKELTLAKSAVVGSEIMFSDKDFMQALGVDDIESVTVTALPDVASGRLMLGESDVKKEQKIPGSKISELRFVPREDEPTSCEVRFRCGADFEYELLCTLYMLAETNYSPTTEMLDSGCLRAHVARNTRYIGAMKASDPENDSLTYAVTKHPENGSITVNDKAYGSYTYIPTADFTGSDSFSYTATDTYGNRSGEVTVDISVDDSSTVYSDMREHWAENAAVQLAEHNIMIGQRMGDELLFEPEKPVSRCEFLVMAMNAAGIRLTPQAVDTVFYDDEDIPNAYKSYVASAESLGIIDGASSDGKRCFFPNNQITRAEAAVILERLIDKNRPVFLPVFADGASIPSWATEAFYCLSSCGIINGVGGGEMAAYTPLDRAQSAQMLLGMINSNAE